MPLDRKKLYSLLIISCLAGYIWLYYSIAYTAKEGKTTYGCLLKNLANIPCPSCGSTRSIISLTKGNFDEAFGLNPIGYIIALIMLVAPLWIIYDMIFKNNSLFKCYQIIERQLRKPKYAVPLIVLLIINWIWNISKGL
jgi:hypothetical protein